MTAWDWVPDEILERAHRAFLLLKGTSQEGRPSVVGNGAFKRVYSLGDDFVLKVSSHHKPLSDEYGIYRLAREMGLGHLFPVTVWGDEPGLGLFEVQERVVPLETIGRDLTPEEKSLLKPVHGGDYKRGLYIADLHAGNIGLTVRDERLVVHDWGIFWYEGHVDLPEEMVL